MTLETIARLENALSIDLIKSALTYVSGYGATASRQQYLNDSAVKVLVKAGVKFYRLYTFCFIIKILIINRLTSLARRVQGREAYEELPEIPLTQ